MSDSDEGTSCYYDNNWLVNNLLLLYVPTIIIIAYFICESNCWNKDKNAFILFFV